ncbi:MAG TPA: hypothetical protein VJ752_12790 [Burkholderiaceae bacterium]|nr:hypothetical protein [Burkholderiaceae bacterium]
MTALAFIVPQAGICGHGFQLRMAASWARQYGLEDDGVHFAAPATLGGIARIFSRLREFGNVGFRILHDRSLLDRLLAEKFYVRLFVIAVVVVK